MTICDHTYMAYCHAPMAVRTPRMRARDIARAPKAEYPRIVARVSLSLLEAVDAFALAHRITRARALEVLLAKALGPDSAGYS